MNDNAVMPYTPSQLKAGFRALGVLPGQIVMLHTSVRAVGPVMGGPNAIIQALLDTLGPDGTLMMYVGWQDIPDFLDDLAEDERQVYLAEHPAFDPATSRAVRDYSILAEFVRTWPGAIRSLNPEASMAAVGAQAEAITRDHPLNYGYGAGSPLEKLVQMNGKVLLLGSPLDTITLLHYAEFKARMVQKHVVRYTCPVLRDGETVWVDVEDYNTGEHHGDYSFEQIARLYLDRTGGGPRKVGDADSYLFDAADLVGFTVGWLEANYGE